MLAPDPAVLNLGIVAHVDAGKTSLTERLLFGSGALAELGSVDAGSSLTDSLALERRRGITIRSAVASFVVGDTMVTLIDTPGHPDFIAEVERVLGVLDGAVLVVSAVEGVQAQTRVLMRALQRLRIPTVVFVNKLDRAGADPARVLREVAERLSPRVLPMGAWRDAGTRDADVSAYGEGDAAFVAGLLEVLAERDDALLAAFVRDESAVAYADLRSALRTQTRQASLHPVYAGSAITGAGVADLVAGLVELLAVREAPAGDPVSGSVFKVERGPAGEKIAYVRMFSGTLRVRDRLPREGGGHGPTITAIRVFDRGQAVRSDTVAAGQIGQLWGLADVSVGDAVGTGRAGLVAPHAFAPPTLETVVEPCRTADRGALHAALTQLAEQDPLIGLRQHDGRRELSLTLYGEVQKEVVAATLAEDYGVEVGFRGSTTICVERPVGTGAAAELIGTDSNPFLATVGLRVDPAPIGRGVSFGLEVELGSMPFAFFTAVEETVRETLRQGLRGWEVLDVAVTMTHSGYYARQSSAHGGFDASMSSTAGDFRLLTPLVLMDALRRAGTRVHEPVHRFRLEVPADAYGAVLPVLTRHRGVPLTSTAHGSAYVLEGDVPASQVHALHQALPALTRGEGVLESEFDRYQPVRGDVPTRARSDHNPLRRKEYLLHVQRRV